MIGARGELESWRQSCACCSLRRDFWGVTLSRPSFRRSALLFATLLVSARQKQRRFSLLASSEALVLAMMSRELRPLIDLAFKARGVTL